MSALRGRRYLIILGVLAGLVGLYAAVGFLIVPRWIRSELTGLIARDYGRTLSLGDVSFNPFSWTLDVTGFSLPDADGRPMISFQRLEVAVSISSVTHLAPTLSDVVLEGPHVGAIVRRNGSLNLADLEKPLAQPVKAKPQARSSRPFKLYVERLAIANGSATYEDDSRAEPFRLDLDPIAFQLLDFSTTGSTPGSYHLTATIGQGGRLDWAGTIRTAPLALHGTLKVAALSARTVAKYLGPVLPAEVSAGTLALQGSFAVDGPAAGSTARGVRMTIDVPQAQVSGLGVRPRRATADDVRIGRFTLGDAHIDLERRSIRIGEIALAGADVRAWLDPRGQLNLLQLLGPPGGKAVASPAAAAGGAAVSARPAATHGPSSASAWHIAAADIRLADAHVSLQDRGVTPPADLTLGPLSARIAGWDSSPGSRLTISLESAVNGKGQVRLSAAGTLEPEALSATLGLSDIDLRALQPYFNEYTALTLVSGSLDSTLAIERGAAGRLTAAGRVDIDDLRTVDDDLERDFIKWQGLHVIGLRYASSPASLRIERIIAVAPYARVIIAPDHTLNVSEALHPRGARAKAVAAKGAGPQTAGKQTAGKQTAAAQTVATQTHGAGGAAAPPGRPARASMPIAIGLVRIADGTADYADLSMQPNFATGIEDLHGAIKGLSSDPRSRAAIDLRGKVDRHSPVEISGEVNLLAATLYTDIRMKFSGLELTRMTPYAVRFAGYKIASGTLDADLHYKVDHGRLTADHQLIIDQLQLGEPVASPHAIKLPLRLAIALLEDRDGVIRIGLPVSGSLSNPQFSLGPLIGKALLHVLTKAVTAPFAMLGRLFGGGPDMNRIDFEPGSAALSPAARARAAALAKALAQRPQLRLEVPAGFTPTLDEPTLVRRHLRDELLALARSGAGAPPGRHRAFRGRAKGPAPPAGPAALELPPVHYRLLCAAYRKTFGAKAPLPVAAHKVPPFEPAIAALRAALLARTQVSEADLQALGQRRAQAIRAAVLAAGGVDAARVAITAAAPQPAAAGKATVALGLK